MNNVYDDEYESVDSGETSGHGTDDSGVESITVSPTSEENGVLSTLMELQDMETTGNNAHVK